MINKKVAPFFSILRNEALRIFNKFLNFAHMTMKHQGKQSRENLGLQSTEYSTERSALNNHLHILLLCLHYYLYEKKIFTCMCKDLMINSQHYEDAMVA